MTISYNWLHQYLPEKIDPNELSAILTSVGLEVEHMKKYETVKGGLQGLFVGEVLTCEPHPNADKLKVTTVSIGREQSSTIVCGAPNVAKGQKVIVATIGTTLYPTHGDSFEIKKAKIRGQESEGMLCAEDEIGLGESHDGIIVLPADANVGTPAHIYYQLPEGDIIYEIGLTPNRMDAMSHMGVAKDVCAYLSNVHQQVGHTKPVTMVIPSTAAINETNPSVELQFHINTELCKRYAGLCIDQVMVSESPDWLQQKLKAVGLKPINNLVDIGNYVMLECGQPLHVFDLTAITGHTIQVNTVNDKTKFQALDGKEITLSDADIMISNANEAMCIAGVYGGLHSGVKTSTTSIFIESAWFLPSSIRKTSVRHGLRTDAATRFEKGVDISQTVYALHRATQLITEIAGGRVVSPVYDYYPEAIQANQITLSYAKIRSLAGKDYSISQIKNILSCLCFAITEDDENGLTVTVPYSKPDITLAADVVEEIMRIDGLDNIPFTGKIQFSLPEQKGYSANVKQQIADQLVAKGFYEIFTNSITNSAYYEGNEGLVKMINSLSANLDTMRPSMLETGLEAIAYNLNRKNNHLKFFEFGRVYAQHDGIYEEDEQLVLFVSAQYRLPHYTEKEIAADIYYVKGIIDAIFGSLKLDYRATDQSTEILLKNKSVGYIKSVPAQKLKALGIKQEVLFVELNWKAFNIALQQNKIHFKEIPKLPSVSRDLALIVSNKTTYADVQVAVKQAKSKLLQEIQLFDVFQHEKIGVDNISYAVNFTFYDANKTMTDSEIESEMNAITSSLESKLGAQIRRN